MSNKLRLWEIVDFIGLLSFLVFLLNVFFNLLNQFNDKIRVVAGIFILYYFIRNFKTLNPVLQALSLVMSLVLLTKNILQFVNMSDPVLGMFTLIFLAMMYERGKIPKETIERIGTILSWK